MQTNYMFYKLKFSTLDSDYSSLKHFLSFLTDSVENIQQMIEKAKDCGDEYIFMQAWY
jgi:hypothetical protein